jgi:hypothetical protein
MEDATSTNSVFRRKKMKKKTCGDLTSKTGLSAALSFNNKK